ncbi:hypothetical protein GA0115256_102727 [Streptomyces sp. DconLS]|nr:hypothetical protein GA0115256_102727 [Streptomyces sp. DconLS]
MRIGEFHDARGPGAEVGAQVGHVVPDVRADRGVVLQLVEAHASAAVRARLDGLESLREILVLEQWSLIRPGTVRLEQEGGRAVDDIGVRLVEEGDGDQKRA